MTGAKVVIELSFTDAVSFEKYRGSLLNKIDNFLKPDIERNLREGGPRHPWDAHSVTIESGIEETQTTKNTPQ